MPRFTWYRNGINLKLAPVLYIKRGSTNKKRHTRFACEKKVKETVKNIYNMKKIIRIGKLKSDCPGYSKSRNGMIKVQLVSTNMV